jgi:hypothetical protein
MQRKYKPIDSKEFTDAEDIDRPSIKGEMRKVYPEIHRKITQCGWSANDVIAWFKERGIPMTENLFRVYLFDLDRENGFKRRPRKEVSNAHLVTKSSIPSPIVIKEIESIAVPVANSLVQIAQFESNKLERENKKTDSKHQIEKLLPNGSVNPEYLNAMRKESKEK